MRRCNRRWNALAGMAVALMSVLPVVCFAGSIGKGYYAVVLDRRNALQGRSVDALVLTRAGRYRLIRRLDENYRLVLNAASGSEAPAVTAGNSRVYDSMIEENHLTPRALRDNNGREIGIVYCGLNPCYIDRRIRADGSILLDVKGDLFLDREITGVLDRAGVKD
jgi:hypothetical protein